MTAELNAFPTAGTQTLRALERYPSRTAFAWPGGSLSYRGATDMIDMAVGQPDRLDADIGVVDRRQDFRDVAARIDHHGLPGRLAPQQRAVLLERRDGKDGDFHGRHSIAPRSHGSAPTAEEGIMRPPATTQPNPP